MKMKKLTKSDLAIIGMYLAHAPLRFEPKKCKSIFHSVTGFFLIQDQLVTSWRDDEGICAFKRLLHPKNEAYPILRHFEDLPDNLKKTFDVIFAKASVSPVEAAGEASAFLYKHRVDMHNLIKQNKAIHFKESKWYGNSENSKKKISRKSK